ncbi:hypothetical protein AB0D57_37640 [Streptomyces sp. NPDC048275]|uniref:hypothetical protein n=1 Tax=Streptomyces sp. NPDC048275 TaxID=3155629 RepID=UPI0033D95B59
MSAREATASPRDAVQPMLACERQQAGGLSMIFRNYQEWLVTQSWCQFSPPDPNQID